MLKVNLGSGSVLLSGWLNIDLCKEADLIYDLTRGLPACKPDFIYSEHFIEHITYEQAGTLLKDCRKKLKGVMRIATPDLELSMKKYFSDWWNQDWLAHTDYRYLNTKCKVINHAFRGWGHQYFYDFDELKDLALRAGFMKVDRVETWVSKHPELSNLETRTDSLIIEIC